MTLSSNLSDSSVTEILVISLVQFHFCANSLPRRTTLFGFSTELALADDCLISLISSSILAISILGLKLNDALSQ
ncbi:hypothetical protein RIR_jg15518.t2 [Rhizophagus irregularis DAOM 181602=DAOM 197198]|nr:hypothetical protein RIR_jg15518.t2 [Rhizophagus irregularis DAOM 181602=DAOM 197198]